MSGQGFELTPFGAVPIGTPYLNPDTTTLEQVQHLVVHADYGHNAAPVSTTPVLVRPPVAPLVAVSKAPFVTMSPRAVVKAARVRVKELRSELKRMKALQAELAELERLLKAAKTKPSASVRPIRGVG